MVLKYIKRIEWPILLKLKLLFIVGLSTCPSGLGQYYNITKKHWNSRRPAMYSRGRNDQNLLPTMSSFASSFAETVSASDEDPLTPAFADAMDAKDPLASFGTGKVPRIFPTFFHCWDAPRKEWGVCKLSTILQISQQLKDLSYQKLPKVTKHEL